ncbi:hypothetical protein LP420_35655 [Massilia sp. B-10]|nr:hypothetical protein LP420_35655 [Massilia sp. B-10]
MSSCIRASRKALRSAPGRLRSASWSSGWGGAGAGAAVCGAAHAHGRGQRIGLDLDAETEFGAFAGTRRDPQFAAQEAHEFARDGQAQPGA